MVHAFLGSDPPPPPPLLYCVAVFSRQGSTDRRQYHCTVPVHSVTDTLIIGQGGGQKQVCEPEIGLQFRALQ